MATSKLDFTNFPLYPEMIRDFSELYIKKLTEIPALNEMTTLVTGIRNDTEIGLGAGSMGMIGKAAQGCGTRTADNKTLATQLKKWELKRWEVFLEFCWSDLETNFGRFARNIGTSISDLTGTDFLKFIETILDEDLVRMFFRFAWFNDKDAALYNASPAGVYYTGTDLTYLTLFDGFFKQIETIVSADATRSTTLSANGQSTYATQDSALTNQLAYEMYLKVIDDAKPALLSQSDKMLLSTGKIARKAMRYLQEKGLSFTLDYSINGLTIYTMDGIKLIAIDWWDEFIRAYQKNGTKYNSPHRILLTTKENLLIGLEGSDYFDTLKIWHDENTEYTYLKVKDAMDVKVLDDEMLQYGV